MPVNVRAVLLHTAAASVMTYGYLNLPDMIANIRMAEMKGGHFQFLTIQGLVLAWTTMILSLGRDLFPSSLLRAAKRTLLMIALPISIVISTIYWNLLLFMPHMILMTSHPEETTPTSSSRIPEPARLPLSVDLALHAAPAISMFIDFYFFEPRYSKSVSRRGSIVLAALAGSWYSWWVERCASYNGFFPYPFLTENPFNIRVLIYAASTLFAAVSFMVLNALHP